MLTVGVVESFVDKLTGVLNGRYVIDREIGRGGMATVYLARDLKHDSSLVAVKVLLPELGFAVGPERFRREIDVASRFSHPNILALNDSGECDGQLYYVMPYVEGESLRSRLDREGQLGIEEAVALTIEVAEALDYAHRANVVHRDIKPENILRCDDVWKIADFGISKLRSSPVTGFTMQGAHSLPWAPPEQRDGAAAHPSADIYAVGRVIGFLLTGSVKVEDYAVLPGQWSAIIKPCLSFSPDERPDAQQLRAKVSQI
jgi:eukaryotic-like serine/threonine-protein kinase